MSKKISSCKLALLTFLFGITIFESSGQKRAKHSIFFSANPYTYVFNEKLGDFNSGASFPLQPSYGYLFAFTHNDAIFFKHMAMSWSPKQKIGRDTAFLFGKKIYSNTIGYMRRINVVDHFRVGVGAGFSYNRLENLFYGDWMGHANTDGNRRNSFGLEGSLEVSVEAFHGFWLVPSVQYYLPVYERNEYPPFDLKHERYINFALFLKFDL
jgi:hypothetical protein